MIIRCAKCGSKKVSIDEKSEGYDLKKGIIGVALLGTGGAVMGINGKTQIYYHCMECGTTLPYPMDSITAQAIEDYLEAPFVFDFMLDREKKIYPNIEWDNSNKMKKKYLTNDDMADDLYEYMLKSGVNALSKENVLKILDLDKNTLMYAFDAFLIVHEHAIKEYTDYIDDDIKYYYIIPDRCYKEISDIVLNVVNEKGTVRESDIEEIVKPYVFSKYIPFVEEEVVLEKIYHTIAEDIGNTKYLMYDIGELYGSVLNNFRLIPYDEEKDENRKDAHKNLRTNSEQISEIVENSIEREIKYIELIEKVAPKLLNENMCPNMEYVKYAVNKILASWSGNYKVDFSEDMGNPTVFKMNQEEIKNDEIQREKEREQKKREQEQERERREKEKKELEAKKKKEADEKHKRRMRDLSLQYFDEIEKILRIYPGISCIEMAMQNEKLKMLHQSEELMNLLKYLAEENKCRYFKINGAYMFYLDDGTVNVDDLIKKKNEEREKRYSHNQVNNGNTTSSQGCYIATCIYGSYDCPQVWTLRRYRDNTLAKTWYGRAFIHTYYAISPTIVKCLGNTKWFKNMWKWKLDNMVNNLQIKGVASTPYEDREW